MSPDIQTIDHFSNKILDGFVVTFTSLLQRNGVQNVIAVFSLEMYFAALNYKLLAIFKKGNGERGTGNGEWGM